MRDCNHAANPDSTWNEYDVKGIFLCKVCAECQKERLAKFSPTVLDDEQQKVAFGRVVASSDYSAVEEQVDSDY